MPPPEVPDPPGPDASGPEVPASSDSTPSADPTGAHDQLSPAESSLEDLGVVIPDDPSGLENERQALLDEQARGIGNASGPDFSQREAPPGLPRFLTRRWHGVGISGPLVIAVLLTVAVIGSFMTILAPSSGPTPLPQPLAEAPSGFTPGEVGALLPSSNVELDGVPLNVQRFRPVVLAVVPRQCPACEDSVRNAHQQAREYGLRLALVGAADQAAQLSELSRAATTRLAPVLVDVDGAVLAAYAGTVPTLVLVHSDGIIGSIVRDPSPTQRLELQLAPLAEPALGRAAI